MQAKELKWSFEVEQDLFEIVKSFVLQKYSLESAYVEFKEKYPMFSLEAIKSHWLIKMPVQRAEINKLVDVHTNVITTMARSWKDHEDDTIIDCMKYREKWNLENPKNKMTIEEACEMASENLDRRDTKACSDRWYKCIKKQKGDGKLRRYRLELKKASV